MGCTKCNFTGFSYGKIPCVCMETKLPPSRHMALALTASLVSAGDLVYYDGSLLGEVTEIELTGMILVKVPKFMGYGCSPEISYDCVKVSVNDPRATFKGFGNRTID